MKNEKLITALVLLVAMLSLGATVYGLLSVINHEGTGSWEFQTIHGETVTIFGKGLYADNSVAMAAQGIGHEVVTLFLGIPWLLVTLYQAKTQGVKGRLLLTGSLAYFFVTYNFFMVLPALNRMFLIYILTSSASFFALVLLLLSFDMKTLAKNFSEKLPVKFIGGFLILEGIMIISLWMQRVLPTFISGEFPLDVLEHYTTLPVQGLDIAYYNTLSIIAGVLLIKRNAYGYLLGTMFSGFLVLLMPALIAKIVAMSFFGTPLEIPVMIVMPGSFIAAVVCLVLIMKHWKTNDRDQAASKLSY